MNACWKLGRATARQVYDALDDGDGREYQTVKTMLDRIADKGYLATDKLGPLRVYTPAVTRKATLKGAIADFTATVLDNSLTPLFQHLAERESIDDDELEALRDLVRRAEEDER